MPVDVHLADIVDAIVEEMETVTQLRDQALQHSRSLIRTCARAIRAMHRHERDQAEALLREADALAQALTVPLVDYPALYHAGYTQDALKELVEAHLLLAFLQDRPLPTPQSLGIPSATYLLGLTEAATELRRFALDLMRQDRVAEAEPYLAIMDDVYGLLLTVDFPDAVTGGLRRQTDVLRGVLERTRGDLTMSLRQERLRHALAELEALMEKENHRGA